MVTSCWLNGPSETVSTRAVLLELITGKRQGLLEKGRSLHLAAKRLYCFSVTPGSSDLQLDWKTTKTLAPLVFLRVAVCDLFFGQVNSGTSRLCRNYRLHDICLYKTVFYFLWGLFTLYMSCIRHPQNHCGDCCGDGCGTFFFLAVSFRPDSSHNLI